jgi:hypothetical protein
MIFSAEAAKVNPLDLDPNLFFMNEWWMFHEYVLIYSRDIKTHMDKHIGAELIIKKKWWLLLRMGFTNKVQCHLSKCAILFPMTYLVFVPMSSFLSWWRFAEIYLKAFPSNNCDLFVYIYTYIYIYASLTIQLLGGCFLFVQLGTMVVVQLICIFVQMAWTHQPDNLTRYCHIA